MVNSIMRTIDSDLETDCFFTNGAALKERFKIHKLCEEANC